MKNIIPYILLCAMMFCSCANDDGPDNIEPLLSANGAIDVTRNEATLTGSVMIKGNTQMPELHFKYGSPTDMGQTTGKLTTDGNEVSARITGLDPGTEYHFCLQGDNGRTTIYSNVATFVTQPNEKPVVGAPKVLSQGPTSVMVEFAIESDGGENVTEAGCLVTESGIDDTRTVYAEEMYSQNGLLKLRIGGLKPNTSYELKAFATNGIGTDVSDALVIATHDAVILGNAGELETLLGDDRYGYTALSFAGPMNGDDLRCLRQMMGRDMDGTPTQGMLHDVDMTDVNIVYGGGSYGSSRYTEDDVVGYGLFADCGRLTRVLLPGTAVSIEKDAFRNCSSLARIAIPASATSVLPSDGCTSLETIDVSEANSGYRTIDGVLFNSGASQIIWFPMGKQGDYSLPETVTSIGDYAFRECSITRMVFPESVTQLGQAVFYDSKVVEVTMPAKLRLVPTATFQKCANLEIVRLGSATELISDYVFDGSRPSHLYVDAKNPPVCNADAFSSSDGYYMRGTCVLHVPASSKTMYEASPAWGMFANITDN